MSEDKMDLAVDGHGHLHRTAMGAVQARARTGTDGQTKTTVRVMVGVLPERNGVPSADILFDLIAIAQRGHPFVRMGYTRTDLARNSLGEHLLKDERFSHVLMLDGDHRHPVDIVERLSRWVIEDPERLVVAEMAFRRGQPYDPCMYMEAADGSGQLYVPSEWERGLIQVDLVGTAGILISRKVFERLPKPWFAYDYSSAEKGWYPSEDIWFSRACQRAGIPIWVDTTTTSPHLIESWVDERTFRTFLQANGGNEEPVTSNE